MMSNYRNVLENMGKRRMEEETATVIFKRSPELQKGYLDPMVAADLQKRSGDSGPVALKEIDHASVEKVSALALELRKQMGVPNKDLSKNIETEEMFFDSDGHFIRIRLYRRSGLNGNSQPVLIYFHGGAFIGGRIEVVENACKDLAEKAAAVVVNVEYRLAPEYPAPAAMNDCYNALKWVYDHAEELKIDKEKIAVAGDSAGGHLAASVSWLDREQRNHFIKFQALIYPTLCLDVKTLEASMWPVEKFQPAPEYMPQLKVELQNMLIYHQVIEKVFVKDGDPKHPMFSPLLAQTFSNMPPTFIAVAEFDFLRPFAERYAGMLQQASVPTTCICYEGAQHAFIDFYGIYPQAEDCIDEIVKMMDDVFG